MEERKAIELHRVGGELPASGQMHLSMQIFDSSGKAVHLNALISEAESEELRATKNVRPVTEAYLVPALLALLNELDPPAAEAPIAP